LDLGRSVTAVVLCDWPGALAKLERASVLSRDPDPSPDFSKY